MIKIVIYLVLYTDLTTRLNGYFVHIRTKPTPEIYGDYYEYRCRFNMGVQCFWQKNNKTIGLGPYEYVDRPNIRNTKECSIKARATDDTARFNDQYPYLECLGVTSVIELHLQSGNSVKLECSSPEDIDCNWKLNDQSISIADRYRYNNIMAKRHKVSDCSIIIDHVNENDVGLWECSRKLNNQTSIKSTDFLAFYKVGKPAINVVIESTSTTVTESTSTTVTDSISTTVMGRLNVNENQTSTTQAVTDTKAVDDLFDKKLKEMEIKLVIISSVVCGVVLLMVVLVVAIWRHKHSTAAKGNSSRPPPSTTSSSDEIYTYIEFENWREAPTTPRRPLPSITLSSIHADTYSTYLVPIDNQMNKPQITFHDNSHVYHEIHPE